MAAPRDLFAERGIKIDQPNIDQPRDLFAERGIKPPISQQPLGALNITPERYKQFQETLKTTGKEGQSGFAQGFGNSLIGLANIMPGMNIPKMNFAPQTPIAKTSGTMADIASYAIPGAAFKAIPGVRAGLGAIEEMPGLNALVKNIGAGTEGALFGAAHAPQGHEGAQAKVGGATGSIMNALMQLMGTKNPFINALVRAGIGGAGGYVAGEHIGMNPLTAAAEGAGTMVAAPALVKQFGNIFEKPGMETLQHLTEAEIKPALEAANRLKTPITPSEASGNPYIANTEGTYGRTGEAAAEKTRIGAERVQAEKSAINDLLDTIQDRSTPEAAKASKKKVADLYEKANKWHLNDQDMAEIKNDPVINAAFDKVKSDPAYQRKLAGVPEDNYAYLNQVKRAMDDMVQGAERTGETVKATEYSSARQDLIDKMDTQAPVYGEARAEAQKGIIRNNINKAMDRAKVTDIKGSTFYKTILGNDTKFADLRESLKNVPEAQAKLDDMRLAWKNLINLEKPNSAAFRSETGLNQSRNWMSKLVDMWNEMTGAKRNVEALRFIHSGEWDKGFKEIQEIKDATARNAALAKLAEKAFNAYMIKK